MHTARVVGPISLQQRLEARGLAQRVPSPIASDAGCRSASPERCIHTVGILGAHFDMKQPWLGVVICGPVDPSQIRKSREGFAAIAAPVFDGISLRSLGWSPTPTDQGIGSGAAEPQRAMTCCGRESRER